MNRNTLYIVIAIVVVVLIALLALNQKGDTTQTRSNSSTTQSAEVEDSANTADTIPPTSTTTSPAQPTNEPAMPDGNDVSVFEISYNGTSFSPSQLTIKNGDVVVFKNNSDATFWPASGPHPTHTNYPEFDPKKAIVTGAEWQFKFTKVGEWTFHNHLNPSATGKIVVQ